MKVLNLYAGIGGNRKLWKDVDVTAVENNPDIAKIYQDFFPNDTMIVTDAHQYLLEHYNEFDFIWSSPPCPTHSITRFMQKKKVYPDMELYQEIILLKQWCKSKWVIENVIPYYDYLIKPTNVLHRHSFWSNFPIVYKLYPKHQTCKIKKEREYLQNVLGFNIDNYKLPDKRKVLRNCVLPELGKHIFDCASVYKQTTLSKKEVLRICKNLDNLKDTFEKIDEQIDDSMKVNPKTWKKEMTI